MNASRTTSEPKQSAGAAATTIDRRSNLSRRELITEYVLPGRPVILTDATKNWAGMGRLTPEFFKNHYGHLTKTIRGVTYTLADYVDRMATSTPDNPAPYPFNFNVEQTMPNLLANLMPEILYGKSNRLRHPLLPRFMLYGTEVYELFFGSRGGAFPVLHTDALSMHTQITQLYGAKEFYLFSPDQTPYMYPKAENSRISAVDAFNPDYEKFPLFRHARPVRVTVEAGETLLFPMGWWHTTQIHEPCITFGRAQLNAGNWSRFVAENYRSLRRQRPLLALPTLLYATALGQLMNVAERFSR